MSDMIPTSSTTEELAAVVAASSPGIDPEAAHQIAEQGSEEHASERQSH